MFSSTAYGGENVLFSDSSVQFLPVESEEPKTWMGPHYYNAMAAMDCKAEGKMSVYLSICLSVSVCPSVV